MSIISEALKKANAERGASTQPAAAPSRVNSGRILATFCVLMIVVTPFLIPRFLNHPAINGGNDLNSAQIPTILPLADAPETRSEAGLALMSVESKNIPAASITPRSTSPALSPGPIAPAFILQGTVWTQSKNSYAILNSNVVREGSVVGNYHVDHIGDGKITLTDGSQTLTIDKSI